MVKTKGLVSTELYDKDKVRGMLDQRRKKKNRCGFGVGGH